ncbi:hypothetical protein GFM44_18510 [Rhizobium leguminosarum bv. viciae]|nr:hypothetical protein [Rhizobium leguminosarum bv. viciae]
MIDLLCIAMKCTRTSAQATRFLRAAGIGRSSGNADPPRNLRHCGSAPKAVTTARPQAGRGLSWTSFLLAVDCRRLDRVSRCRAVYIWRLHTVVHDRVAHGRAAARF